jgi:hypothetical protein
LGFVVALGGGLLNQYQGFGLVFWRAVAVIITFAKFKLRVGLVLVRGFLKPFYGFGLVYGDAFAEKIRVTKVIPRGGVALVRGLLEPFDGFGLVARRPLDSRIISEGKVKLRVD